MMRRTGFLLALLAGMAMFGARTVPLRAQQAPDATQIKIFAPWNFDGTLNASLQVRSRDSFPPPFGCQAASISIARPDAWRCGTDDPCFEPPLGPPSDPATLACASSPWAGNVQLLTLQTPLRSRDDCQTPPRCHLPLDLNSRPWAVELANGVRCTASTGTISSLAGVGLIYGCASVDGTPAGSAGSATDGLDRSQPLWRVFYQAPGGYVLEQVNVLVAWY